MSYGRDVLLREHALAGLKHRLEWEIPDLCLFGRVRITDMELRTGMTNERAFLAVIEAKLKTTLGEMADQLRAPSFPVHDGPWEPRPARKAA